MNRQSESPKERINVTYKPATGDQTEEIEIPFKVTVLGQFNPDEEKKPVENKKPIRIDKDNFNEVIKHQDLSVELTVPNMLTNDDGELKVDLKIQGIKDFSPENIVENVDELKTLMQLRQSLIALKGPLGNMPAFRKAIEGAIADKDERKKLLKELTSDSDE
jgi:type VI secretion system protein ImpB